MEIKLHRYNSFSTHCCLCVVLMFLVLIISDRFSSLISFSGYSKFEFSTNYSVSIVQLQAKVTGSDHIHFVDDSSALTVTSSIHRFRNTTVIRKISKLSREEELEQGLARARASIRKAVTFGSDVNRSDVVRNVIYRNPAAFYQSYMEMERRFKVYVYSEGDPPIVHDGPCKDIYTIEGRFIHEMEHGARRYRTRDPKRAHVYFMPFSVTWMVKYLYKPLTYDHSPLRQFVADYVRVLSTKYPFWNRTHGADHFMLACHDWGPHASRGDHLLYNTSIRVLCNANTSEGFNPRKDVSLPEIHLYGGNVPPQLLSPPPANTTRPHLAFFAGGLHGPIRPLLLKHWKDRESDLRVFEYLPKHLDYYSFMLRSKFCLCPSGHEVASPRIVESIYAECVPVILSDHYVLPFSDVLRWDAFSIQLNVSEIPRLEEVLRSVPEEKYERLKEGLRTVRTHFMLNQPAKRFDVFHMILHSIWLRRLNLRLG
ncbi:probable glycosyltransferase At5g25310 [Ricinus communis]|uniref:Catalytic, putative n=1 Tax=Ricinus communis TaxID=3988 RepID=B9RP20_RICCO|nr:probable glycosyltransferase At5g25310 [Ricinus communis]EEF46938.1 catalytic, putative [Ricinus communis]|eukprot:XP_002515489.1 probable glycosyltransferase At5g25310 [Ricinus communis]